MQSRILAFSTAFKGSPPWVQSMQQAPKLRIAQFICRSCQRKFSTSPALRAAAKNTERDRMYKSRLLIYDAGDTRTTWVSFWKAMALLQFGTTLVFAVPPLWNNENQPDPNLRKAQAILVGVLGTIPTLTMAYVTAPFAHQVFLQIPEHARRSRQNLMNFARSLNNPASTSTTANTKLEFVTLRIFPFRKNTTAFLHELRALPPMKFRLANLEIPKTDEWAKRQREKGLWMRMLEVIAEPRYKFFVKEGKMFTAKTGVPGVWEEVAMRIKSQTNKQVKDEKAEMAAAAPRGTIRRPVVKGPVVLRRPPKVVEEARIKRQTARSSR
ncbi:uncharacterized protein EKO05_0003932 [Ascochyta rabiei]|uniref:uncharacterized protein n=1 Tax=Didymella rabiei TaxID=5454 RepID=UPI0018FF7725|nr:uncharacterized protein EKO05_0003932 [Ascochyta rabiei]UPX13424.1 hypothetical protein EKO05_0003932 [Ascochyta rabiei]